MGSPTRQIHGSNRALTLPEAPKSLQIFIKKRVATILFYKFYKFRGDFHI